MPFPEPRLGLVVSYSYLWHHEHRAGREEGRKDRPCVVVLAVENRDDGTVLARVAPVTHARPDNLAHALELPAPVKRHLGLDDEKSWVILDEINEFEWPGFDLRAVPGNPARFDYGFLPPRLFAELMIRLREVWRAGQGKRANRDK